MQTCPNGLRSPLEQLSRQHGLQLDVVMKVGISTAMKDVASSGSPFGFDKLIVPIVELDVGVTKLGGARVAREKEKVVFSNFKERGRLVLRDSDK